ncbi:uncharacterized protein [Eurosta solidaginis]|uniref:uncharacterized protein n=1 Tax=Eurosta solidaginis TaxID=178769 RepID=UPI0035308890
MKTAVLLGVFVALAAITTASSSAAASSKPFVRSRYSKRWRILETTEANIVNTTLTTEPMKVAAANDSVAESTTASDVATIGEQNIISSSLKSLMSKTTQKPRKGVFSTTTEHPRHPGPNGLPLDYDYYGNGNENEDESGHK